MLVEPGAAAGDVEFARDCPLGTTAIVALQSLLLVFERTRLESNQRIAMKVMSVFV